LILASASSRRIELLRTTGIEFDVVPSEVDDTIDPEETPDGFARRVAQQEAESAVAELPERIVLAARTVVVVDNRVIGPPMDERAAVEILRQLSGRAHLVVTAVCLLDPTAESTRTRTIVARTKVEIASLSEDEIAWYVATGEPLATPGAYAAEGLASRFVTRIEGSSSNVLGLPLSDVYALCKASGLVNF
jgi:septum formation protein